jgi:hypothetical protein
MPEVGRELEALLGAPDVERCLRGLQGGSLSELACCYHEPGKPTPGCGCGEQAQGLSENGGGKARRQVEAKLAERKGRPLTPEERQWVERHVPDVETEAWERLKASLDPGGTKRWF